MLKILKFSVFYRSLVSLAIGVFLLGSSRLQANNVTATLEGQLVVVTGDNLGNSIVLSQNAAGTLTVRGLNGTLVNGLPLVQFPGLAINAIEILMNGGNDRVAFSNVSVANDLFVNLGAGTDRFLTGANPSTVGANLSIEGDSGTDIIRITGWSVFGDLNVNGQTGILNAQIANTTVGFNLTLIGDDANDPISVSGSTAGGSTSIETKKGNDNVSVAQFSGFDLFISTDEGNDQVALSDVVTDEDTGVSTSSNNDTVTFTNVMSGKNINVSLDSGTDRFTGTNVFAQFDAIFNGGAGVDTFGDNGVAGGEKTEIIEFEVFP